VRREGFDKERSEHLGAIACRTCKTNFILLWLQQERADAALLSSGPPAEPSPPAQLEQSRAKRETTATFGCRPQTAYCVWQRFCTRGGSRILFRE